MSHDWDSIITRHNFFLQKRNFHSGILKSFHSNISASASNFSVTALLGMAVVFRLQKPTWFWKKKGVQFMLGNILMEIYCSKTWGFYGHELLETIQVLFFYLGAEFKRNFQTNENFHFQSNVFVQNCKCIFGKNIYKIFYFFNNTVFSDCTFYKLFKRNNIQPHTYTFSSSRLLSLKTRWRRRTGIGKSTHQSVSKEERQPAILPPNPCPHQMWFRQTWLQFRETLAHQSQQRNQLRG